MTTPSFERIQIDRLSPQSRWALENLAVPHRLDDVELDDLAAEHDLTRRVVKRMLDTLDTEIRAQQVGAEIPAHTKQEIAALEEQLQRHGQIYPVIRARLDGRILGVVDGHRREALLTGLGLRVKYRDVDVESEADARALGLSLNLARRQLDSRRLREIVGDEVLFDPKRSDRAIAELLGVHHATVAKARRELEKLGLVDTVSTRVGRDGVAQPVAAAPAAPRRAEKLTALLGALHELAKSESRDVAHARADELVVEVLKALGVEDIAKTFETIVRRDKR